MTPENIESIVFYKSFYEAIKVIPDAASRLAAYEAILGYAFKDVMDVVKDPFANIILEMAKPQIDANTKRRLNGSKGGAPAGNQNAKKNNLKQPPVELENNQKQPNVNVNVNVNENVNVNDNDNKGKAKSFAPPTFEDIENYCKEADIKIDIEHFMDYYQTKKWKTSKGPMKDWKLAVRNWHRNDKKWNVQQGVNGCRQTSTNKFGDFEQRDYDYKELEKLLN